MRAYLRSLDYDVEEADEFQQLLAEPFLRRVLRPLGSRFLGSIAMVRAPAPTSAAGASSADCRHIGEGKSATLD